MGTEPGLNLPAAAVNKSVNILRGFPRVVGFMPSMAGGFRKTLGKRRHFMGSGNQISIFSLMTIRITATRSTGGGLSGPCCARSIQAKTNIFWKLIVFLKILDCFQSE